MPATGNLSQAGGWLLAGGRAVEPDPFAQVLAPGAAGLARQPERDGQVAQQQRHGEDVQQDGAGAARPPLHHA